MMRRTPTRTLAARMHSGAWAGVFVLAGVVGAAWGQSGQDQYGRQQPAPIVRQAPASQSQQPAAANPYVSAPGSYQRPSRLGQPHQHLAEWMQAHSNLSLGEQQRALAAEPGFRQLPPDVQMRMHERLAQLNAMNPQQRQRVIGHTEAMERLTPPQRVQVRSALADLGALPDDRRKFVARTFRTLRDMPEPQRQAYLNSAQFRGEFSDHERTVLGNLFAAAPYMPPPTQQAQPMQPQGQPMQPQVQGPRF